MSELAMTAREWREAKARVSARHEAILAAATERDHRMSLNETEAECAAVATAPRVSLAEMEEAIAARYDFRAGEAFSALGMPVMRGSDVLSICILVMKNGFMVIGHSAPASAENFNRDLGRKLAYENAIRQLWPLMGFALRERLAAAMGNQRSEDPVVQQGQTPDPDWPI
jgi:hypothetical protein